MHRRSTLALVVLLGCGSQGPGTSPDGGDPPADAGADGTGSPDAPVNPPPTARFVFPPADGATDAAALRVRGTAADPDGIAAVRVNGALAVSTDGFQTWSAQVTLTPGANAIIVETEDRRGSIAAAAARVDILRRPITFLHRPIALAVASSTRLLVVDPDVGTLVAVDPTTGVRAALPSPAGGPSLGSVSDLVLDPGANRALAAAYTSIIAVDLTTGVRSTISGGTVGTGPAFQQVLGLALDSAGNRVLAADAGQNALVAVDLATGNRTVVSAGVSAVDVHLDGARAIVLTNESSRPVVAVDLATGAQTTLSDAGDGPPMFINTGHDLALDANHTKAYVIGFNQVFVIDLATGMRTSMPTSGVFVSPLDVVIDPAQARLLGVGIGELVFAIDLATGNRTSIGDVQLGAGPTPSWQEAAFRLPGTESLLVLDDDNSLIRVDLADAKRTHLGYAGVSNPRAPDMVLDQAGARALVIDHVQDKLVGVDLATLAPTVLSSSTVGTGPLFDDADALTLDPANNRALMGGDLSGVIAVDLATGNRTIVAPGVTPDDMVLDATGNRVFAVESTPLVPCRFMTIDLGTGVDTCLNGSGLALSSPAVIVRSGGQLFVGEMRPEGGTIVRIDPVTFQGTIVAGPAVGRGPELRFFEDMFADENGILTVFFVYYDSPVFVDPTSGDRVVLANP